MNTPARSFCAAIAVIGLAACGGGGGGGGDSPALTGGGGQGPTPPVISPITTSNARQASSAAAELASSRVGLLGLTALSDSGLAGGVEARPSRAGQPLALRAALGRLPTAVKPAQHSKGRAAKVVETQTEPCAEGGSVTIVTDIADPNADNPSPGDSAQLSFNGCREGGTTLGGALKLTVRSFAGDWDNGTGTFGADLEFLGLSSAVSAQSSLSFGGRLGMNVSQAGQNGFRMAGTYTGLSLDEFTNGARTSNTTIESGSFTFEEQDASATQTFDGHIRSTQGDSTLRLRLRTLEPLRFDQTSQYPVSGIMAAEGFPGSVRLTYLRDGFVTVELDTDGDGRMESSETTTVARLIEG